MNKQLIRTAAGVLAAVLLFPVSVSAMSAKNFVLMDAATGRVLEEKNADSRSLIASTTKIMTGLLICEQCNVLDRFRIPREAVGIEGSSLYLREGEVLTIQELLYGLMLRSGNDAAQALAIYCGGTVEGFVGMMNDKARLLGLENTHFANPSGLDHPGHYSTAKDLAVLTAYAMENPIFSQIVSTKTVKIGERYLKNHNKLLWRVEGVDGVKTGYTKAAGRILVSSATRDGRRLIAVTISDPNDWQDHQALLERGFETYHVRQVVAEGTQVGSCPVIGGEKKEVPLVAGEDFFCSLAEGETADLHIPGTGFAYAPVVEGTEAGVAYVTVGGKAMGTVPLYYGDTAEQAAPKEQTIWEKFLGGIRS